MSDPNDPPRVTREGPHPVVRRTLEVRRVTLLTPHLTRVTLGGPELEGFASPSPDDHVKVFFPTPEGPVGRDYTPRRHDQGAAELDLDFVLHAGGVGSAWAERARPGDRLTLGGPRGSTLVRYAFQWYLLLGDETALPSIARRLEELPEGAPALAFIEVAGPEDELPLSTRADLQLTWLHRDGLPPGTSRRLEVALAATPLPEGEGFAWLAGEAEVVRRLRQHLLERGLPSEHLRASAYWTLRAEG